MKKKRLITNADDFGWSRGISDGILHAHREGIITSATLMANQPASQYALEQAKQQAPKLGIGIHLRLCDGSPVLPAAEIRSLVDQQGKFYSISEIKSRLWHGKVSHAEIEAEFRAQIRWMIERGVTPTHGDSHHHLHLHPLVAGPFTRALLAEGIRRARPALKKYWPSNGIISGTHAGSVYRRVLVESYLHIVDWMILQKLEAPDCRLAPHPRYKEDLDLLSEAWNAAVENLPPGTYELECHPGFSERGFYDTDYWRERRELEIRILTDPNLRALIQRNGIELISYSQL